ncbi:MAG TPA: hypothetical protein VD867_11435 [Burkholderiales bacterium]|nr:hypothetical protein [Burkholderiales bacterium]
MLFSQMELPPGIEAEFNDWYETEHIPVRLALPGFSRAVRYRECDAGRRYLAIYEIDDLAVLDSPGYNVVKTRPSERTAFMLKNVKGFTRYTCTQTYDSRSVTDGPEYLSAVAFAVPEAERARFDDWYVKEHIPLLMRCSDWLRVRCYKVISGDGGPWTDFALHDLASLDAMDSPERRAARTGPKRDALKNEPWFESSGRWLFEAISVQNA